MLTAGSRLGPYEILAPIGAGGMGEVYRARDTRLGRDVAVKVLPTAYAADPDRLRRFEQEARAAAALNHPNILAVHDVGAESQSASSGLAVPYVVSELLDGETLRERLAAGPPPVRRAVEYAVQIARGLAAAHEKGIVHRDLKPENIFVTTDGRVKILDFGLAKLTQPDPTSGGVTALPTTPPDTLPGLVVGTLGYMAPEQVRGQPADHRADLFAFGTILYELLSGRRAFRGDTAADTMSAILKDDPPDLPVAERQIPSGLERIVDRCLVKNPAARFKSADDLAFALEALSSQSGSLATTIPRAGRRERAAWILAALASLGVLVATAAVWTLRRAATAPAQPLVRVDVELASAEPGFAVSLSPDGSRLVYTVRTDNRRLAVRRLDQPKATELFGTEGGNAGPLQPFFSPDGQWIGYFLTGKLKKVPVDGGSAITLCDTTIAAGASWGDDGSIVAALDNRGGLWRVPAAGGAPTLLTALNRDSGDGLDAANSERIARSTESQVTVSAEQWPEVLPGANAVIFTANIRPGPGRLDDATVDALSFRNKARTTLLRGAHHARYLASGHLVYLNKGTLYAVPFDVDRLQVHGTPVTVLEDVSQFDVSRNGALVYRRASQVGLMVIQWLDGAGNRTPLVAKPGRYTWPRLSPDGQRLALVIADGRSQDIWVYDWPRETMTRLTSGGGAHTAPVWSPDGRLIVYSGSGGMFWMSSDGAGQPRPLTENKNRQQPRSFTPDGTRLAFDELSPTTGTDIWTVAVERDGAQLRAGKPELFLQTPFDEEGAVFSPDGRWLAYMSDESGTMATYVRSFPDRGGKWRISATSTGRVPVWSRNGRELFFAGAGINSAAYTAKGDSFVVDKPRVWSTLRLVAPNRTGNFDLAPDGARVAAILPAEPDEHVTLLLNLFEDVRRRLSSQGK